MHNTTAAPLNSDEYQARLKALNSRIDVQKEELVQILEDDLGLCKADAQQIAAASAESSRRTWQEYLRGLTEHAA